VFLIKSKAQAAMEFLMTYGWAIMVVLVAIGTLAYFGVLSPDRFLPRKCFLEAGLGCEDFKIDENSITLSVINGKGEDIIISSIKVKDCTGTASGTMPNGGEATFTIAGCNNVVSEKFSGDVNITYTSESGLLHVNKGNIADRIEVGTSQGQNWYDTNWQFRKKITIDDTKVDETLSNFAVLISLTDTDLRDDAQVDGDDILFTSSDGTSKLSHEIESFDGSTGFLVAWVKESVSSSSDTEIYMYYGNTVASNQQDSANVWDSNYAAIWHLKEDPVTEPSPQYKDSTSNNNDGTKQGSSANQLISAKINGGQDFDGGNDYIDVCTNNCPASLSISGNQYTLEAWARVPSGGVNNDKGLIDKRLSGNDERYFLGIADNSGGTDLINCRVTTDGSGHVRFDTAGVPLNVWAYIVCRYDGSLLNNQLQGWVDGVNIANTDATGNILDTGSDDVILGKRYNSRYYEGDFDELRISNIARSNEYITTTYNNQNSPSTFYSVGSEETQS
jgi:hypothetical protein